MLNVNQATKNAWLNNETKTYRVVLNEEEISSSKIYTKTMKIDESVNDRDSLHFMGCIPSRLEIEMREIDTDIEGQKIQVYAKAGNTTELCLFTGYVTSANTDAKKTKVKVIAYDKLYEINDTDVSEWYKTRLFPMTVKEMRDSLFSELQITQEQTTLCNDDRLVYETIGGSIKGEVILKNICEICGVMGMMSRDGETFRYITLPKFSLDTVEPYRIRSLQYEDFFCKPINKLWIREDSDDIGATAGTGTNTYIVQGNILCYGQTSQDLETIAVALLNQIGGITYVPTTADIVGYPIYEVGDPITYERPDGEYTMTYVLSRQMSGNSSLVDKIKGMGCENYGNALSNNYDELVQLRGQSLRIKKSIEGVTQEVSTIRDDYASKSQLQQTSDSLTAQIEYLQQEIDGQVSMYYGHGEPQMDGYPTWMFTYNIPVNDTVQLRDNLMFEYTEIGYRKNLRSLYFDEDNNQAYRFSVVDGEFGWVEVADSELGAILQRLSSLELTTEAITSEVSQIETTYATKTELDTKVEQTAQGIASTVSATYQTKNDADTTRTNLQTQITQNASNINLKVSKGAVVSEINQSPDRIVLNSNRLVVNSTNFKLDENGNIQISGDLRSVQSDSFYSKVAPWGIDSYYNGSLVGKLSCSNGGRMLSLVGTNKLSFGKFKEGSQFNYDIYGEWGSDGLFLRTALYAGWVCFGNEGDDRVRLERITYAGDYGVGCRNSFYAYGSMGCAGTKYRVVETDHYGKRGMNAFETAYANFGDNGSCKIEEDNICIVEFDKMWLETVDIEKPYQVLITPTSEKNNAWVEKKSDSFIVHGENGATFDWMIIARQKDYADIRMQKIDIE